MQVSDAGLVPSLPVYPWQGKYKFPGFNVLRISTVAGAGKNFIGLRVENLHPRVDGKILAEFFDAHGVTVKNLEISCDPISGISKGYGYLECHSHEDAVFALKKSGKILFGRAVKIFADDTLPTFS